MLLAVFSSALSLVPYMVVYQILLLIIKNEVTLHTILKWAGIGIGAAVLQAIFTALAGICSHTAAFNTMHRIKVRVLEHMSKFNLGYFQEHAPGQIKTTLFDDVDRIENFLAHSTLELAQAIVVPLMMFFSVAAELEDGTHYADTHDPGNCNPDGTHGQISGSDGRICR